MVMLMTDMTAMYGKSRILLTLSGGFVRTVSWTYSGKVYCWLLCYMIISLRRSNGSSETTISIGVTRRANFIDQVLHAPLLLVSSFEGCQLSLVWFGKRRSSMLL